MPESKTFTGVSTRTWQRLQALGQERHGTQFKPTDETRGTATTATPFGSLILDYDHDPDQETITYTIVTKPMLVMSPMIWSGIESTLIGLRNSDTETT